MELKEKSTLPSSPSPAAKANCGFSRHCGRKLQDLSPPTPGTPGRPRKQPWAITETGINERRKRVQEKDIPFEIRLLRNLS
jgi:hypothetical protein